MYCLFIEYKSLDDIYEIVEKMQSIYVPGLEFFGIVEKSIMGAYIKYHTDVFTDKKVYKELADILYDIDYTGNFKIIKELT